ncbi:MAG: hypothetical protein H6R33_605 [Actinobacteria bacterium]|nr:hypothetical protein [Actinomycetota bacterium]
MAPSAPAAMTQATAAAPPVRSRVTRRISNCSTGSNSTVNTRKCTVNRALTGSKAAGPPTSARARAPMIWKRYEPREATIVPPTM